MGSFPSGWFSALLSQRHSIPNLSSVPKMTEFSRKYVPCQWKSQSGTFSRHSVEPPSQSAWITETNVTGIGIVGVAPFVRVDVIGARKKCDGVAVFDKYGVSEIFSNATSCPRCTAYHFDPFVVAEVVDVDDVHRSIDSGIGQLLLTTLYPFTQMTPLVRYQTGDLVERLPPASACGDTAAIRPLGRLQLAPARRDAGATHLQGVPADFLDALDEIPDVARLRRFAGVQGVDPGAGSRPRVRYEAIEDGPITARYTIEVRYDPIDHRKRAAEVRDRLQAALATGAERRGLEKPTVEVNIVGPNVLNDPREFRFK